MDIKNGVNIVDSPTDQTNQTDQTNLLSADIIDTNDMNQTKRYGDVKILRTKYKICIKKMLGEGSFSKVYLAINKKKERFAIKVIRLVNLDITRLDKFRRELEISLDLDHKNIVKCYEIYESANGWYIVNEYCNCGTFINIIKKFKNSTTTKDDLKGKEILAHFYLTQLRDAIHYLHSKGIVHRDLKPANILISKSKETNEETLKLADFGFARYFDFSDEKINDDMTATLCGSPTYMAPEMILKGHYNIKADLWSFGVIMYELLYGRNPYNSPKSCRHLQLRMLNEPILFPEIYSEKCSDLMKKLLKVETTERIEWEDFFNHEWFLLKLENDFDANVNNDNVDEINSTNNFDKCEDEQSDLKQTANDFTTQTANDFTTQTTDDLSDSSLNRRMLFEAFEQSKQEDEMAVLKLREKNKSNNMDKTINIHIKKNFINSEKQEGILSDDELKPTQKNKSVLEKEEKIKNTFQLLKDRGRIGSDIAKDLEKSPFSSTEFDSGFNGEFNRSNDFSTAFQDLLENSLDAYFGQDTKPAENISNSVVTIDTVNTVDINKKEKPKIKKCKMSVGESVIRILSDSIGYSFSYPRNYGSPT